MAVHAVDLLGDEGVDVRAHWLNGAADEDFGELAHGDHPDLELYVQGLRQADSQATQADPHGASVERVPRVGGVRCAHSHGKAGGERDQVIAVGRGDGHRAVERGDGGVV